MSSAVARILPTEYRPWWAQRMFHRSRAPIRVVVAGRQSGKSHMLSEEVKDIMLRRPGTTSLLLMPTYRSTKGMLSHLRRAFKPLEGRYKWKEFDKYFELYNQSRLYLRTDDASGVPSRGLTIDGVYAVDEAGFISTEAHTAARLTQAAVINPLCIVTTTPNGRGNWVYKEWLAGQPGPDKDPSIDSFRFRSTDSPYCNAEFVRTLRERIGAQRAMQELDAQFTGDASAAFSPDAIDALMSSARIPMRGSQLAIGVDLAKERDWTVAIACNEFGECLPLLRIQKVNWVDVEARLLEYLERWPHSVMVLDKGSGGGYGGYLEDALGRALGSKARLHGVRTGSAGVKAQVIETLIADVENERLKVSYTEHTQQIRHELSFFEQKRIKTAGVERWRYEGPTTEGEHDDCVIALALANHGRLHCFGEGQHLKADFSGFTTSVVRGTSTTAPGSFGGFGGV